MEQRAELNSEVTQIKETVLSKKQKKPKKLDTRIKVHEIVAAPDYLYLSAREFTQHFTNLYSDEEFDHLRKTFKVPADAARTMGEVIVGGGFRWPNEPVRHKTLDLIGDFALLGTPLKAHVLAARSGHAANVEIVRKLRQFQERKEIELKYQGGKAQKGLLDIIRRLGTEDVPRLRIGVGRPPQQMNAADYVLSRFRSAEREAVESAIQRAADSLECWVSEGIDAAMNRFNSAEA